MAFAVDDYGNVRLHSGEARDRMFAAGLKPGSHFDYLDTLETREDLEALFNTLSSVKDVNGRPACFTPYALPCNIDFETMAGEGNQRYVRELLPVTYGKLESMDEAYVGAWALWQEGIKRKLLVPQFHGREHLHLRIFEDRIKRKDPELLLNLENRSYSLFNQEQNGESKWAAAFWFHNAEDIATMEDILVSGLADFKSVYGYNSHAFTAPAQEFPPALEAVLPQLGISLLDKPFFKKRNLGNGKTRPEFFYTGMEIQPGLKAVVRNCVFEPAVNRNHAVKEALDQIEAAFFMNKPAIISSHRVNFCGHIDENNRRESLQSLKELLQAITKKWPDAEFVSVPDLMAKMN